MSTPIITTFKDFGTALAPLSLNIPAASGNDRLLVLHIGGNADTGKLVTTVSLNGVEGEIFHNEIRDGGGGALSAIALFREADLPATVGSNDLYVETNGGIIYKRIVALFWERVTDQVSPIKNFTFTGALNLPLPLAVSQDLAGAVGHTGVVFASYSHNPATVASRSISSTDVLAEIDLQSVSARNSVMVGIDDSVAATPQSYAIASAIGLDTATEDLNSIVYGSYSLQISEPPAPPPRLVIDAKQLVGSSVAELASGVELDLFVTDRETSDVVVPDARYTVDGSGNIIITSPLLTLGSFYDVCARDLSTPNKKGSYSFSHEAVASV